jgi:hypothetical protein
LRINGSQEISSQNAIKEKACSEANENDVSLVREASLVARKSKIYSKRMTKKLINAAQLVMILLNIFTLFLVIITKHLSKNRMYFNQPKAIAY